LTRTERLLTKSLRELEEAGLVSRTVVDTSPPQVTYALTQNGPAPGTLKKNNTGLTRNGETGISYGILFEDP